MNEIIQKRIVVAILFLLCVAYVVSVVWGTPSTKTLITQKNAATIESVPFILSTSSERVLFALVYDNAPESWPLLGLSKASFVYEVPVEGGRTRLLAITDATRIATSTVMGPLRSVRPVFLDIAKEFDAVIVHVGGSPDALSRIIREKLFTLNEFYRGKYFYRAQSRPRPHNVMTHGHLLADALSHFSLSSSQFEPVYYATTTVLIAQSPVSPSFSFGELTVHWKADSGGEYVREVNGVPWHDGEGTAIRASTIAFMFTDMPVIDQELRREIRVSGSGEGLLCAAGVCEQATWKHEKKAQRTRWYDAHKKELLFYPGQVWIEVLPVGTPITFDQ